MSGFSCICCIVNMGAASKTLKIANKYGVRGGTIFIGQGTVKSHILEMLGITAERKEILTMVVENELAHGAIKGISDDMHLTKPHHGIAFSYPISEFIGSKNVIDANMYNAEEKNNMYNIIYAVVERGKAEDVIDAASMVGARGGTIVNARGAGIHEVQKVFSIEIEPEKEVVFILVKRTLKDKVVASIKEHLKIDQPGNGILYVHEINEVYGLHED